MAVASTCPNENQLGRLIEGSLPDSDLQRLTEHVEFCSTCQQTLQTIASGEIVIDSLVGELDSLNPPSDSAYWETIARFRIGDDEDDGFRSHDTPMADYPLIDDTRSPEKKPAEGQSVEPKRFDGLEFLAPSDDPAYIGKLHHFQIARVLGRGGMGIVLEAFDTQLQRSVAIKVLIPQLQNNDIARQRFCREGRAAAAISHEHVVAMYQVAKATDDGVAYLVMQLIDGETLDRRLSNAQSLPPQEVARIGMQIAAGLSAAHARGMVHRDIKPANIMIEKDTNRVKLTDFGLARTTDDVKLTQTGMVTGTPIYMSPEQAMGGNADERSDLFSLGVVMYEMATGISPFTAPTAVGVMKRIMDEHPAAPHRVNAAIRKPLSDLIMSLLEKKPEDRPASSASLATALASIVSEYGPISPLQVPAVAANEVKKLSGNYRRVERRWVVAAWLAATAGVVLAAVTYWVFRPDGGDHFPSVVLPDNPGTVWSIDFAPSGDKIAAAIEDGSVRIWSIADQQLLKSFIAHRGIVWMVAYHPTRPLVMTSGDDSAVKLWDADSFELVKEWKAESSIRSAAFSPYGNRIVAGEQMGASRVWDLATGKAVATLRGHTSAVHNVSLDPTAHRIATSSRDGTIRVWDMSRVASNLKPIHN